MEILFLLIPISLVIIAAAVLAFRWAIKNQQFDDLKSPGMIPLLDDTEDELARFKAEQMTKKSATKSEQ